MMYLTRSTLSGFVSMLCLNVMRTTLQLVVAVVVVSSGSASASPPPTQYWVVTPAGGGYATIDTCRIACCNTTASGVGGWVATVKNQYEQELLQKAVNQSLPSVPSPPFPGALLGASRSPSNREFRWTEGPLNGTLFWVGLTYQSIGAHAIGFTNFGSGEPNDFFYREDSLQIRRSDGSWNDIHVPSSDVARCACQSLPIASASVPYSLSKSRGTFGAGVSLSLSLSLSHCYPTHKAAAEVAHR